MTNTPSDDNKTVSPKLDLDEVDGGEEPEAPKFIEPIQSVQVPEGDTARFECVVTGRPMPEITWFHGEKMIKPTDLIEIGHDKEGKNWVVVRKAVPTLQGTFTCWAENQVGRTMCGADLTLASEAEEISMVSVDSSAIVEGPQSRDFEMSVDFEGVDELEEEGRPPSFAMPVQDVEVKPGETAHLRVKVAGKPTPEVTWYRDGKVLQPSPRHTIMSDTEGNASLVISEAQPGDDAEYLCKAVNPHGVVSCRADVIVEEEPSGVKVEKPTILIQPEAAAPLQAEPKAVAEAGLEVKGKELDITSLSEAPSITSEDAMEETDVEEKDEEEVEIHEAEDVTSPEVKLEIKMEDLEKHPEDVIQKVTQKREEEKPQKMEMVMPVEVTPLQEPKPGDMAPIFTEPLKKTTMKPGETLEITCKVEGLPRPEVQWLVDDVPIQPDEHYRTEYRPDGTCVLTIHDVERMDEGQYAVKAINPVGVASTESEMLVEVPEVMVEKPTVLAHPEAAAPLQAEPAAPVEPGFEVKEKEPDITSLGEAVPATAEDVIEETEDVEEKEEEEEEVEILEAEDVESPDKTKPKIKKEPRKEEVVMPQKHSDKGYLA
ncbi:myosin light chain kinase, smooth muscle-like [Diadema antillarum]|uniref:myosin light chain kinase, smooth muscle-like n=1 Tax=Diadema antillarum TaxID=105358 RepID=UPI003A8452F8